MKIIRHPHKMFVYSLSLLLSVQQISCMHPQIAQTTPAQHPDQKSNSELGVMLREHNNVDLLIDTAQRAIGGIEDHDGTLHHMFTITLPARGRDPVKTVSHTQEELAELLIQKQEQRQLYDDDFWFNWTKYWEKDYNKQLIRSNFVLITTLAYAKRCENFKPDTSIIDNLPKRAQDIDPDIITYLQRGFADIDPAKKCLSMPVSEISAKLNTIFHFFDNPPICCWHSSAQRAKKLEYNVFLRSRVIPFVYFIEKQRRIKALQIPKQMPSNQQPPPVPLQHPPHNPSIIIIGSPSGQPYHSTMYPHQNPPPYNQGANPFLADSGLGIQ